MTLHRVAFNNAVLMADGRNDPDAHIVVNQAAVVASVALFTDVSIPLSLSLSFSLSLSLTLNLLIIQSLTVSFTSCMSQFASLLLRFKPAA